MTEKAVERAAAPIPRSALDRAAKPFRWWAGVTCVVYSALTTIIYGAYDLWPTAQHFPYGLAWAIGAPVLLAILISFAQVFAEFVAPLYFLSLIPDTYYSARPLLWIGVQAAQVDGRMDLHEVYTAILISASISFWIARFGEVLLFGWRRGDHWYNVAFEWCYTLAACAAIVWYLG